MTATAATGPVTRTMPPGGLTGDLSRGGVLMAIAVFAAVAFRHSLLGDFPSAFDEVAHVSYVRAMAEHPALFPDVSQLLMQRDDLSGWSAAHNYLNHPSLYYLLMAPFSGSGRDGAMGLRLINAAMVTGALLLTILAGIRLFAGELERRFFAVTAVAFPKTAAIGGMVNNDNFALVAASVTFYALVGESPVALAAGLALAGWSKLTALVALGFVAGLWRLGAVLRGAPLVSRLHVALVVGGLVGSIPYLHNLMSFGHLLYWNESFVQVPLAERVNLTFSHFIWAFSVIFSERWAVDEGMLMDFVWLPLGLMAVLLAALACGGVVGGPRRDLRAAYLGAAAGMLAVHIVFGWQFYRQFGNVSTPEPRYYAVLWPGFALALTCALSAAARAAPATARWAVIAAAALLVFWPTLPARALLETFGLA